MRSFFVFLFALAALGMGGIWLLAQTAPSASAEYDVVLAEPAPASSEAASAEDAATAETSDAFEDVFADVLSEDAAVEEAEETQRSFGVTAAPPARPAEPEVATRSLAEQFETREVTYNRPPSTLALDRPIDVSLVINATGVEGAGADALEGFDGEIVDRDVELTDVVSAQLTGAGFDIVEQTVERQRLSPRVLNRWQWRVTPTREGTQTLVLEIFGYAEGALEGEPLDAYRDEIVVEVRNLDRVISFAREYEPVFAVGAGIFGALSALFGFLRFRGDRKRRKGG